MEEDIKIKELFGDRRIVGLAGEKSSGKTNNLMALLKEFRQLNKETPIYIYGVNERTLNWAKKFKNVFEVSSIEQMTDKKNCLIIIDEFNKLKLNDRRYTDLLNSFIDFIYHNNNWVIFSSPNLREFNSTICAKIERWALKTLRMADLINGSQLKDAVINYNGRCKVINNIQVDKNKLLILNDAYEKIIELEYIPEIDDKKTNVDIFKFAKDKNDKM